ncbi:MAG: cobalamin-binding protein [Gammaproteobacteria bacterium]|nr:cobalamin-binding protein [Gammaproteobacteria bacterium]
MRVVSLNCSNTEIVCALGCADMLVGVDDHSDFPADVVNALPRVGPDLGIDVDKVSALRPDLVLASLTVPGHENIVATLETAGLNYHAPEPVSLDDVYRDVLEIAGILGVSHKGHAVVDDMRQRIQGHESPKSSHAPTILVQWWPKPVIAPGKDSWVNDLLAAAGAINPLAERDVKSTPLEDTEVLALDPDAVVISWCGVRPEKYRPEVVYRNERWPTMKAILNRRVYCVPESYLGRPSPRLVQGYEALRDIVRALNDY